MPVAFVQKIKEYGRADKVSNGGHNAVLETCHIEVYVSNGVAAYCVDQGSHPSPSEVNIG